MSAERKPNWKKAARNIGLAALIALPILNYKSSSRVIGSYTEKWADCSEGEAIDPIYPYDLIAVPGAGIYIDEFNNPYINGADTGRLTAAAQAYVDGLAPRIILLNGRQESSPQIAIDYLKNAIEAISEGRIKPHSETIVTDTESINTATNMERLSEFLPSNQVEKVLIITNEFHSQRVAILACNYGINSKVLTVEELTSQKWSGNSALIDTKEAIEVVALMYDPKGVLPTAAKSIVNFLEELQ